VRSVIPENAPEGNVGMCRAQTGLHGAAWQCKLGLEKSRGRDMSML
jgi:hypothetical protein